MNISKRFSLPRPPRGRRRASAACRPLLDGLEDRTLMAAPVAVGGDPSVNPAEFRVTVFAEGLNYPKSMDQLSDGSILVATSRPKYLPGQFWDSIGELVRLVDADKNGVADGPGTVLATGLPGMLTSVRVAGGLVFATSSEGGAERISVLRAGAKPSDPLTPVGSINFSFPGGWWHTSYALAVRPTPGGSGTYDLFFNIGSEFNVEPTAHTVPVSGMVSGQLQGDSIYMVTVDPRTATPTVSNPTQIAKGLRNAAGMAFDPATGDLYFEDNGIDGLVDGNEPESADELNRIAFADIGGAVEDFGYPYNYIQYRTGVEVGGGAIDPLFAFQPIPNPLNGSESEGPSDIAMAPAGFPAGLNRGVFVSFSGRGGTAGLQNEENPLVFANLANGRYFHFVSNDEPAVGHITGLLSTSDSLFAADLDWTGRLFGTAGAGVIYQIKAVAPAPGHASATFLGTDSETQGDWPGNYGGDGYVLADIAAASPPYADIAVSGASDWTWSASTTDPRALRVPGSDTGRAATWYSSTGFDVDVDLVDGQPHKLTLYAVDWDFNGQRSQRFDLYDADTGALLDSRSIDHFQGGVYVSWTVTGHVRIRVTNTGSPNAVLSGIFLGDVPGTTAAFLGSDSETQGDWPGNYGGDGYYLPSLASALPPYAEITVSGESSWTWSESTTDPRALRVPGSDTGKAATWYSSTGFDVDVELVDGQPHKLTLYAVDWDLGGQRSQRFDLYDADTGALLDSRSIDHFQGGVYVSWTVTGHVRIRVTNTGPINAVLSGIFLGDVLGTTAAFLGTDSETRGDWQADYGADGYVLPGVTGSVPSYATITPSGESSWTWAASTTDPRAPRIPGGTTGAAATWYSSTSFDVNVNITDGQSHRLTLYAVDWDYNGQRSQRFDLYDADTGALLDSRSIDHFQGGVYVSWNISGNVRIRVTNTGSPNAVLSGIFLGDPPGASASFLGTDTTTRGDWPAAFGEEGYLLTGVSASIPAYATITPSGESSWTWAASTTDPRALELPSGLSREAATWYSGSSFDVDVAIHDGQPHRLTIYAVDWDGNGSRSQRIELLDADSGAVLDSRTLDDFQDGVYLSWTITGRVRLRLTNLGSPNAVLSGLFFDAEP